MQIQVTVEDIRNGQRSDCNQCAIALAVRRATGCKDVHVNTHSIEVYREEVRETRCFITPLDARRFIDRFDKGEAVEPITFELGGFETVRG